MRRVSTFILAIIAVGCADLRGAAGDQCARRAAGCRAAPDSELVNAITAAWAIELDPLFPTRGPFMIGAGGDSAWSVAVYERLSEARPHYFVVATDTAHAAHLSGVTVEMLGDTAKVTTSLSQCTTRPTTYNWVESGMTHKLLEHQGKWVLLPGSLGHLAHGKC
jgi:hypothetical protein